MSNRKAAWILAMAAACAVPTISICTLTSDAEAVPAARYRVGMKVRAKRTCTVQGYEVKKGVVLGVVAVQNDDKGKTLAVDLSFSGMTIANVPAQVVDSLFNPA